ncbi:hypothetical protein MAXJ12_02826 [Mesorhizobium alhagi CCNWXJ12-2]|uniref:Uncharacterized protein n=1 Tax=Mesorhizobium alhagi CCNWXJ12-2 TaxID=1107882 RepID=H0HKB0_9HYPH|nr:hypothetical protein MAXJ12_02826 [Mesorhizobium alhagi CCNWXJ12-2]
MVSSWLVEGRFARGENRVALMDEGAGAIKPPEGESWLRTC